ncbi:MAG TPA: hypothetical protein VFK69_01350 [Candidatus Eisenbacteria bacterium]|nr:hypothetical protein [Candidatus Eisenbacteria bacterium]
MTTAAADYLMRLSGLAVSFTGLANVPPWRVSSALAAAMFTLYAVFLFRRRRHVAPGPTPVQTRINYAIFALVLWLNVIGVLRRSGPAPYALALTSLLVLGGWVFPQNLDLFFRQ